MRFFAPLLVACALPAVLAADPAPSTTAAAAPATTTAAPTTSAAATTSTAAPQSSSATTTSDASSSSSAATTGGGVGGQLSDLPTIAGVGVPTIGVPDTSEAPFMHKSNLPDGTVFICVGAALGFFGVAILAWRGLVAWSLHRSVQRAAQTQNLGRAHAMSLNPSSQKRAMYSTVGSSTMSVDHLSAAPVGSSRPAKPFASNPGGTPPRHQSQSSLFFSPTAGGAAGLRDPASRSSTYLPPGFYPPGTAQAAAGGSATHVGPPHMPSVSSLSLAAAGANRFSTRSGASPPGSPSLPPSRGGLPPSRGGALPSRGTDAPFNRSSTANLSMYGQGIGSQSNLSLNMAGGSSIPGGRAPSAYLEDLFESHGTGPRDRI